MGTTHDEKLAACRRTTVAGIFYREAREERQENL